MRQPERFQIVVGNTQQKIHGSQKAVIMLGQLFRSRAKITWTLGDFLKIMNLV